MGILKISRLEDYSLLKDFYCGVTEMDNFIHRSNGLMLSVKNHYCKAFMVKDDDALVAIFALSFDSVTLDLDNKEDLFEGYLSKIPDIDEEYTNNFKSKLHHPALEITYLAVAQQYRGQGYGRKIIERIAMAARNQKLAGCEFLTVDAYFNDEYRASPFYTKCQFNQLDLTPNSKDTIRMYRMLYAKQLYDEETD
jgi:GNAT superfamily N-acetyltransferase